MIIRQRRTLLDPFLLKVVFPYLDSGRHSTLLRLAAFFHEDVSPRQARLQVREWHSELMESLKHYGERWRKSAHALAQLMQPQSLVTIAVTAQEQRCEQGNSCSER